MKYTIIIVCSLSIFGLVTPSKILGILPFTGSHYILARGLTVGLAEAGHDVTVVSAVGEKNPPKNGTYRDIVLTGFLEKMEEMRKGMNFFEMDATNPILNYIVMAKLMVNFHEEVLAHPEMQKLIQSGEKFDVLLTEQFMNDGFKALAPHFGSHMVLLSSVRANDWTAAVVNHPLPISYIPTITLEYTSHMTFFQRCNNLLFWFVNKLIHYLYLYPTYNGMIKKHIPNAPELFDVLYNNSLLLVNSHTSYNDPMPFVPNMVDIGGYWIKPPKKLPKDIQDFLDNAPEGVIYFSMGSNLRSADLPTEKRDAILRVFSKLKQKVLWKWENDDLPGKPANVKLGKWLPQQDILAHPNVKLFITHGGLLSTTETIYNGKPILAIPVFGDQKNNAGVAVEKGFGRMLLYRELNENTFESNIKELLTNPRYYKEAQARSKLYHDQQTKPLERAIYWIEYVIRHEGAPHLRVAGLKLSWLAYNLVDVILFLVIVCVLSLALTTWTVKRICCRTKTKLKTN